MSIIFIEGFDYYANVANLSASNWTLNPTSLVDMPAGRFAGLAFRFNGSTSQRLASRIFAGTNTFTLGVAYRLGDPTVIGSNHPLIAFNTAAAAAQFRIVLDTSGQVSIQRGTTGSLAVSALGEPVFAANTWYYLEIEAFVADSGGFVRVYRDGTLIVEFDGDTRNQAGTDLVEMIRFFGKRRWHQRRAEYRQHRRHLPHQQRHSPWAVPDQHAPTRGRHRRRRLDAEQRQHPLQQGQQ